MKNEEVKAVLRNPKYEEMAKELVSAVNLIMKESTWCRRALVRDAQGEQLFYPNDENAVAWDILGALHNVNASKETFAFLRRTAILMGYRDLDKFNDNVTHTIVMAFFKGAVTALGFELIILNKAGERIL